MLEEIYYLFLRLSHKTLQKIMIYMPGAKSGKGILKQLLKYMESRKSCKIMTIAFAIYRKCTITFIFDKVFTPK